MKGVIFDFNGTLFWDTPLHEMAWGALAKELRGTEFTEEENQKLTGSTNRLITEYCLDRKVSDEEQAVISERKEVVYREMCLKNPDIMKFAPGAVELFEFLNEHKIPMTIATSSEWLNVKFFIDNFNLGKWFDVSKIVFDQGKYPGKPFPDMYLHAAEVIGVDPKDCIVFEDAKAGIEAAYRANVGRIYAINAKERKEEYSKLPGVTACLKDFNEFDRSVIKI